MLDYFCVCACLMEVSMSYLGVMLFGLLSKQFHPHSFLLFLPLFVFLNCILRTNTRIQYKHCFRSPVVTVYLNYSPNSLAGYSKKENLSIVIALLIVCTHTQTA